MNLEWLNFNLADSVRISEPSRRCSLTFTFFAIHACINCSLFIKSAALDCQSTYITIFQLLDMIIPLHPLHLAS